MCCVFLGSLHPFSKNSNCQLDYIYSGSEIFLNTNFSCIIHHFLSTYFPNKPFCLSQGVSSLQMNVNIVFYLKTTFFHHKTTFFHHKTIIVHHKTIMFLLFSPIFPCILPILPLDSPLSPRLFQDTLGGHSCLGAGRFGAIGAQEANKRVIFNRTAPWRIGHTEIWSCYGLIMIYIRMG